MEKRITKVNLKGKEVKEMKKIKYCFVFMVAILAFALMSTSVQAATILSLIQDGPNQASDENREYLIDNNFTLPGQLDVGDALRGSISFNTLNSVSPNVGGATGNSELSGVFQVLITSVTAIPLGPNVQYYFTFGPDPAFEGIYGLGAIVALFDDSTPDYAGDFDDPSPSTPPAGPDDGTPGQTVPPSSADVSVGPYLTEEGFLSLATDGTPFITLGFLGLLGEGADGQTISFPAGTPPSILPSFGLTSGTSFANSNLALNVLAYGPAAAGLQVNRITPGIFGGPVDFSLSQQLRGVYDLDTPFEVSSNTNVSFNATVPEPSTLLLLGFGLLGVGTLYSRRNMKK